MKKFKGLRNLDIIISEAKKQGWDIDTVHLTKEVTTFT